jgi:hypothetical protein
MSLVPGGFVYDEDSGRLCCLLDNLRSVLDVVIAVIPLVVIIRKIASHFDRDTPRPDEQNFQVLPKLGKLRKSFFL